MKFIKQDLIIASRSSSLALKQCEIFKEYLKNINTSVLKIVTTGDKIIDNISNLCEISNNQINIKGKTTEKLGVIGKEKAIATEVIVSIVKYDQ